MEGPFHGLAVILEKKQKKVNSFFVGDKITADAVLDKVLKDRIILARDGYKEFILLKMSKIELGRRKSKKKKKKKVSVSGPSFALDAPSREYKEEGFEREGESIVMSKDYRKKLLTEDFSQVLQAAKAEPYFEGGSLNGFRLTRIRENSIYEKSGLQNDDVVKEINGVALVDTAQAIKLLNSLRGESEIEIMILRGGSQMNINMKVNDMVNKIKNLISDNVQKNLKKIALDYWLPVVLSMVLGYILSTISTSLLVPKMVEIITKGKQKIIVSAAPERISKNINYRDLKKSVLERNIFNVDGEYPVEKEEEIKDVVVQVKKNKFNIQSPCTKCTLPLTLVGIIFVHNSDQSMAIVKDEGFSQPDVYMPGDAIIDHEDSYIVAIKEDHIILNNNEKKECLFSSKKAAQSSSKDQGESEKVIPTKKKRDIVVLQHSWVMSQLGDGFGKIIQNSRLIPNTVNGVVKGFKVYGIKRGTFV